MQISEPLSLDLFLVSFLVPVHFMFLCISYSLHVCTRFVLAYAIYVPRHKAPNTGSALTVDFNEFGIQECIYYVVHNYGCCFAVNSKLGFRGLSLLVPPVSPSARSSAPAARCVTPLYRPGNYGCCLFCPYRGRLAVCVFASCSVSSWWWWSQFTSGRSSTVFYVACLSLYPCI